MWRQPVQLLFGTEGYVPQYTGLVGMVWAGAAGVAVVPPLVLLDPVVVVAVFFFVELGVADC